MKWLISIIALFGAVTLPCAAAAKQWEAAGGEQNVI